MRWAARRRARSPSGCAGGEELAELGVVGGPVCGVQVLCLGCEDLGAVLVDQALLESGQDVREVVDQGAGHRAQPGAAVR